MKVLIPRIIVMMLFYPVTSCFSQQLTIDGRFGGSVFFQGGESSTGLLFGSGLDVQLGGQFSLRSELSVTTHADTPIQIAGLVKYTMPLEFSRITLYANGGLGIWFFPGGPYLSADLGGGAIFHISQKFGIPFDWRFSPIFTSQKTILSLSITSGILYFL